MKTRKKEIKFTVAFDIFENRLTDDIIELKFLKNKWHILKSNNYNDIWHVVLNNQEPQTYQFKTYKQLKKRLINDIKEMIINKYASVKLKF